MILKLAKNINPGGSNLCFEVLGEMIQFDYTLVKVGGVQLPKGGD